MLSSRLSLLPCEFPITQERIDASRFQFQGFPRQGDFRGHEIKEALLALPEGYTASVSCPGAGELQLAALSVFAEPGEEQDIDLLFPAAQFAALEGLR